MSSHEYEPIHKPEFQDLWGLVHELVPTEAELLAYDEEDGGTPEEAAAAEVGRIWNIDQSNLREGESVTLCVCNEEGRHRLGALLKAEYGMEDLPVGFIEISIKRPEASFSSMVYLMETGVVMAAIDTSVVDDAVLLDDSEDCYDFADSLGLGSQWAKAMFQAVDPGVNTTNEAVDLNSYQIEQVYSFLNPLENRV